MIRSNSTPRISVNKLGEFIVSKPRRQAKIIYDQKNPSDYIVIYYKDAQEAIAKLIADGMEDVGALERQIRTLDQREVVTVYDSRRVAGNIETIETFLAMLDDVGLKGGSARVGDNSLPRMTIAGVEVSVRPELVISEQGAKGRTLIGGAKLHFPRTNPLTEEAAGYVSAVTQMYCEDCLHGEGTPFGPYCPVIDVASGRFWPGARSIADRKKEIEQACAHIAALWPTI
jgi:hypothetical protein